MLSRSLISALSTNDWYSIDKTDQVTFIGKSADSGLIGLKSIP